MLRQPLVNGSLRATSPYAGKVDWIGGRGSSSPGLRGRVGVRLGACGEAPHPEFVRKAHKFRPLPASGRGKGHKKWRCPALAGNRE